MYAKINGGTVVKFPYTFGDLRKDNPNVSFPRNITINIMQKYGMVGVLRTPKPNAGQLERVVADGIEMVNSQWFEKWKVEQMFDDTPYATRQEQEAEYLAQLDANVAESVRRERDEKLKETDWLALSDVIMSEEVKTYRQALRDITEQDGFPNSLNWPTKP